MAGQHYASLIQTIDLGAYGGAELFFGDINHDGKPEIIAYQGPGVLGARMYAGLNQIKPHLPRSQCVTAFDMDGRRLWTWGEINPPDRPYISHAYEACVSIGDADNDGKAEVVVALGNAVILLDGLTGREKRSVSLPEDYFYIVHVLWRPTAGHEAALVVKNGEEDYKGGPYAQPVIGLNAELKIVWGPDVIPGAGHHVLTVPIRADSSTGYLIGYCAVNPNGRIEWAVDSIDGGRIEAEKQHVDYSVAWHDSGRQLFALAGSDRGYVAESGGKMLFSMTEGHVQGVAVGRFQGGDQIQVAFYNAPDGPIVVYNMQGQRVLRAETRHVDENTNPLCFLKNRPEQAFHRNRPIITAPGGDRDWIAYADGGWPWGLDGAGRSNLTFPPPEDGRINWDEAKNISDLIRIDDMGYSYAMKTIGITPLSVPLTAIYNRRFLWLYAVNK